ncbi:uncharacterized protein LOC144161675 [Haemaphysalis longicornis]
MAVARMVFASRDFTMKIARSKLSRMRNTVFILVTTVSVFAFSQLGNFTALKDLLQDDNLKHIEYWSHEVGQAALREGKQLEATRLPHRGGWAVEARCHEGIDVLFFVHACSRQWRRRAVLRDTLVEEAAARRFNWAAVFFVGRRANDPLLDAWLNLEADALGALVVFPFEDGYRTVTPKWMNGMQWVADHCPNVPVIVKLDDDVTVHPFKLSQYLQTELPREPARLHCCVMVGQPVDRQAGPRLSICVLIVRDTGGGAGYDYPMQSTPSASPERPSPVHTPVHRASRRKRGLSPEYGRLDFTAPRRQASEPQVMAQALTPQVTLQQPRTPAIFHGEVFEDVEDWLEQFERVASFNQWDARQKLREVYYALEHGARTWFENREARLSTWEEFRQELLESFATTDRRDLAQRLLESRIRKPNETVTMFTEDMARLFKRADPEMSEPRKLRYLMHGIKEQLFAGLVRNPPRTVKDFVREATAIERALQERCRQFNRVNGTSSGTAGALTSMANDTTLRDIIRSIVREELQLSGIGGLEPAPASVADVVRQEIRQALSIVEQQVQPPQASYVTALRRQLPIAHTPLPPLAPRTDPRLQRADSATYSRSQQQSSYGTQVRKTDVWRDDNNQPLCYHCGEAGHVYRRCPYREIGLRGYSPAASRPRFGQRPAEIEAYLAARQSPAPILRRSQSPPPSILRRSQSPSSGSSPDRRDPRGPPRGRSPSPGRGN